MCGGALLWLLIVDSARPCSLHSDPRPRASHALQCCQQQHVVLSSAIIWLVHNLPDTGQQSSFLPLKVCWGLFFITSVFHWSFGLMEAHQPLIPCVRDLCHIKEFLLQEIIGGRSSISWHIRDGPTQFAGKFFASIFWCTFAGDPKIWIERRWNVSDLVHVTCHMSLSECVIMWVDQ